MQILRRENCWVLQNSDGEELCRVENVGFDEALDCFAANIPELMVALDEFKTDDFCGNGAKPKRQREHGGTQGQRKKGSGARFRELMMQGKTNAECLEIVRAEFAESKATLSDAAFNRAMLRKNPEGFREDGTKR